MERVRSPRHPLHRAFGMLAALIAVGGLVLSGPLLLHHRVVAELTSHVQPMVVANAHLRAVLSDASIGLGDYLLAGDRRQLDAYDVAHSEYSLAVDDLRRLATPGERAGIDVMVARAEDWWQFAVRQRTDVSRAEAAAAYGVRGGDLLAAFQDANTDIDLKLAARTARLQSEAARSYALTVVLLGGLTVAGVLSAVRAGRRLGRTPLAAVPESPAAGSPVLGSPVLGSPASSSPTSEQELAARLQELDAVKSEFMSTISHELRTPLTSICGYVELLADAEAGELNPAQQRMLDVIGRNTRRLRQLIEDILMLSKIETGGFRIAPRPVELGTLVEQALAAVSPAAAKASVALRSEVDGPLPLSADPGQLDRMLVNLLVNGVKFTPPGGTVTVRARRDGDELVLVIADTGMGIPANEQAELFSRFFRASNAVRQAIAGTGLGLSIVQTIVDQHGGHIDVASTENVGTTVTVRLPAAESVAVPS